MPLPRVNSPLAHALISQVNSVFVTTAYIESEEYGFPCDKSTNATHKCQSKLKDGLVVQNADGQCVCTGSSKTYYPRDAEKMDVSFVHFFNTPRSTQVSGDQSTEISGGSDQDHSTHPLKTTFIRADGTNMTWQPPDEITINLRDLLASANHASCKKDSVADLRDGKSDGKCAMGITLDEPNVDVRYDSSNKSKYPVIAAGIKPWAN